MSGCLLNILLDPLFILPWGINLGAAGAGLATFLSNCVACMYFFILLFVVENGPMYVCIRPSMFSFRKEIVAGVCGVWIPAAIQNILNVTGMTILNNFTSYYKLGGSGGHGDCTEDQYGSTLPCAGILPGDYAAGQLQLCQQKRNMRLNFRPSFRFPL